MQATHEDKVLVRALGNASGLDPEPAANGMDGVVIAQQVFAEQPGWVTISIRSVGCEKSDLY